MAQRQTAAYWLAPLLLLGTGTAVVLANQIVANQAAVSAQAQLLTLVRYVFTCSLSVALLARERRRGAAGAAASRRTPLARRTQLMLLLLGGMDVACYGVYNVGFSACGSALASVVLAAGSQLFTCLISVTMLRRVLRPRHVLAVTVVTAGLLLRSLELELRGGGGRGGSRQLYGVACVMASALLFSVLGCIYEFLMNPPAGGTTVSQPQAAVAITGISLLAAGAHQALVVLPRWDSLVAGPFAASGATLRAVAGTHLLYGLVTAVHHFVQLRLLASHGAMTVGLVHALRASLVSLLSHALFCGGRHPHLCLTLWRGLSALTVSLGAAQWVLAGKPLSAAAAKPAAEGLKDKTE